MPKLQIVVPHSLSQDEAISRIKTLLNSVKIQFAHKISNLFEDWDGVTGAFSFSIMGLTVSGILTVKPAEVELSGSVPFALIIFKRKIESEIREQAKKLLA